MSELKNLIAEMNLTPEKLAKLQSAAAGGPMAMMAALGELNLPPDFLPRLMGALMSNPMALKDLMEEIGPENIPEHLQSGIDEFIKKAKDPI
jgi:hypothetical protein